MDRPTRTDINTSLTVTLMRQQIRQLRRDVTALWWFAISLFFLLVIFVWF